MSLLAHHFFRFGFPFFFCSAGGTSILSIGIVTFRYLTSTAPTNGSSRPSNNWIFSAFSANNVLERPSVETSKKILKVVPELTDDGARHALLQLTPVIRLRGTRTALVLHRSLHALNSTQPFYTNS